MLYLIEILHQTTTVSLRQRNAPSLYLIEILHQTTTRNAAAANRDKLYLIEILHQTTTLARPALSQLVLYLIEILHQTTTAAFAWFFVCSCILSKFYIKPQRYPHPEIHAPVVSYRNSTSNHNGTVDVLPGRPVVSYRNSTSNHNSSRRALR